jgi:hypothetical protein
LAAALFATPAGSVYARRNTIVHPQNAAAFLALVYLGLRANAGFVEEASFEREPYYATANAGNVRLGLILREILAPRATAAVFWAGTPMYYSGLRGIDMLGKCDAHVAALPPDLSGAAAFNGMSSVPGHNKYDLEYSIGRLQPTYVQGFSWGSQNLMPRAAEHYRLVRYKGVDLWLRTGSPDVRWERIRRGT